METIEECGNKVCEIPDCIESAGMGRLDDMEVCDGCFEEGKQ